MTLPKPTEQLSPEQQAAANQLEAVAEKLKEVDAKVVQDATATSSIAAKRKPVPNYGAVPSGADADLRGSLKAIQRAALRAREVARQTGTDLIVSRSGQVVSIQPKPKTTP